MAYFDGLVAGSFKSDAQGNHYVMPYGVMAKARRFRTEQDYLAARRFLLVTYQIMLPLIFVSVIAFQWLGWMALLPLLLLIPAWPLLVYPRMTRNSVPTDMRDSLADNLERSGQAHNGVQLMLMMLLSLLFVAIGIWLAIKGMPLGYACAAFFGLGAVVLGIMLAKRRK